MALKKCKECGHQVSTKAAACPGCGARMPRRTSLLTWIVGIILVFTIIPAVIVGSLDSSPDTGQAASVHHAAAVAAPAAHQDRAPHAVRSAAAPIQAGAYDVEKGDPPGTLTKLKRAAKLAAQGANCAAVTLSTYVPRSQRFPGHENEPYYVTCTAKHGPVQGFAYGVYFTEADLTAGHVKNQEQPIDKNRALLLCRQAILGRLRFPSSADFSALTAYVSDNGTSNREVMLNFTALNGVGNRIPQRGKCIVTPDGHTDVTILNR